MKQCPVCHKDVEDDAKFCPSCGAQIDSTDKKLSWGEKKKRRMIEEQQQLDAAVLHEDELKDIPTLPLESLKTTHIGTTKKAFNKNLIILISTSFIILLCLASIVLFRFMDINQTLKVFLVFVMFMIFASALAFLTNSIYAVRMLNNMLKCDFAIKKLEFGKPPKMNVKGELYDLTVTSNCSICENSNMHIEELNGKFVAVCNQNRLHLLLINTQDLRAKMIPEEKMEPKENNEN